MFFGIFRTLLVLMFVLIKGKVVFAHALKAHETVDIEPLVLNLGTRWR